ncbi:ATP-dependent DNA helicase RecG [Methylocella sp.]|uniref:ATP-dependent DNA helicase RecG n=1 Tax=Methylocella sp. TaxID=1978226 RepID=UPI00378416E2
MRPSLLDPLFASAASLPGVGPKTGRLLDRLLRGPGGGEARVLDLLFHAPTALIDRRLRPKIAEAPLDSYVVVEASVVSHTPSRGRGPFRVLVEDETGDVLLVFFLANAEWVEKSLPVGARRWICGRLELWEGHRQMVHPDRILDEAGLAKLEPVEPVYPLTEGLRQRSIAKAVAGALARLPALPEWGAPPGLPAFSDALRALHRPQEPKDLLADAPARMRLAYDELFAGQLALALMRARAKERPGRASVGDGRLAAKILAALPFELTGAQKAAIAEIRADLASETRMLRLLQGDVGSGKTLVALLAMAACVEAGRQAALMAPTELLARQHFASLARFSAPAGLRVALLTGREKGTARRAFLEALAAGEIDVAVGTHALFQEGVEFADLALAVVDEQHRFGVRQRLSLGEKGERADLLAMTATPIPRTLALTYFGDMDISALREKPPGRQKIETRALPLERIDELIGRLGAALRSGAQAYWVCPLVEESAESDLSAAGARAAELRQIFGEEAVGLVHGRMRGKDKDEAMAAFSGGATKILVATTVIEVGVDVPAASIMVIEHAERFGLAQLHQLRGRVGRGAAQSFCMLLYKGPLGEAGKARIAILRESDDGFAIAEEDLRLRGEGEVMGARQSGLPGFRLADPAAHGDLLAFARGEAQAAVASDPGLSGARGRALRLLLHLFERAEAIRLLAAG